MSSLLGKLVSYTNLTQGAKEHEEAESGEGARRRAVKVSKSVSAEGPHLGSQSAMDLDAGNRCFPLGC